MKIAVDFDSTLFNTTKKLSELLDPPEDRITSPNDVPDWDFVVNRWGDDFWDHLHTAHADETLEPMPGAIEAFRKLQVIAGPSRVYVLTNNEEATLPNIRARLRQHGIHTHVVSSNGDKERGGKMSHDWDILIDDDPRIEDPGDGRVVIRYGTGYNDSDNDWRDIMQQVVAVIRAGRVL